MFSRRGAVLRARVLRELCSAVFVYHTGDVRLHTAHSPEEENRPVFHANEHSPAKWPRAQSCLLPPATLLPPPSTLLPAVERLTHPHGNMQGSWLPRHSVGQFHLTGGKNSPGVSIKALSPKCQGETKEIP